MLLQMIGYSLGCFREFLFPANLKFIRGKENGHTNYREWNPVLISINPFGVE